MIHGAPLSSDHHRGLIDFVMDGCRDYNLPYEIDGARCQVDLIGILLKWPTSLLQLNTEIFNYLLN
jgi:hypothetical protein